MVVEKVSVGVKAPIQDTALRGGGGNGGDAVSEWNYALDKEFECWIGK